MTTKTVIEPIVLSTLPALGADFSGGTFAGITTRADGTHCAVVLLPGKGEGLTWTKAKTWAKKQGGELPTRPVAAMLIGTGPQTNTTPLTPGCATSTTAPSTTTTSTTSLRLSPSA